MLYPLDHTSLLFLERGIDSRRMRVFFWVNFGFSLRHFRSLKTIQFGSLFDKTVHNLNPFWFPPKDFKPHFAYNISVKSPVFLCEHCRFPNYRGGAFPCIILRNITLNSLLFPPYVILPAQHRIGSSERSYYRGK